MNCSYKYCIVILEPSQTDWKNLCSASIISKHILMTAAHCLRTHENKRQVLVGQSVLKSDTFETTRQVLNIAKVEQHPKYIDYIAYFDIGLIYTVEEIQFNAAVQPVCLPTAPSQNSDDLDGNIAVVAGWGKESEDGINANGILRRISLAVFSYETCHQKYDLTGNSDDARNRKTFLPQMFTNQMLCAGSTVIFILKNKSFI